MGNRVVWRVGLGVSTLMMAGVVPLSSTGLAADPGGGSTGPLTVAPLGPVSGRAQSAGCSGVCGATSQLPDWVSDVSAAAADDAWVVGHESVVAAASHWNGKSWVSRPPRSPGSNYNSLDAVDPRASNNVWAVGTRSDDGDSFDPLIEHWNGTRWRVLPCPSPPDLAVSFLYDVSADSADDAWAVGRSFDSRGRNLIALAAHWDGSEWKLVPVPDGIEELPQVDAISPTDAWAVGYLHQKGLPSAAVVVHWDGASWTVVKQLDHAYLGAVYAAGPQDVTVVGVAGRRTLALHWDGSQWTEMPAKTHRRAGLYDVTTDGAGGVLVVGRLINRSVAHLHPLAMRWTGSRWTRDQVDALPADTWLNRVTTVSPALAWAVGTVGELPGRRILIMWDGTGWHEVTA